MAKNVRADLKILGERIRSVRKANSWSQEEFAYKCELDRSYIGGIERGERNISFSTLCKIAETLRTTLADLTKGLPRSKR